MGVGHGTIYQVGDLYPDVALNAELLRAAAGESALPQITQESVEVGPPVDGISRYTFTLEANRECTQVAIHMLRGGGLLPCSCAHPGPGQCICASTEQAICPLTRRRTFVEGPAGVFQGSFDGPEAVDPYTFFILDCEVEQAGETELIFSSNIIHLDDAG